MLKIGDFSKLSRIGIRMLRHYDEIGILYPDTVDDFTGYRYYSEAQLPLAGQIQTLKSLGFSLSAIGEILEKYENQQEIEQFLLLKKKELEEESEKVLQKLQLLDSTLKWLRKDGNLVEIQISVEGSYADTEHVRFKTVPPVQIASATYKGSYEQINRVNEAVANWVLANGYDFNGKSFCIYHVSPHDASGPDELVTEVCFPVKKK